MDAANARSKGLPIERIEILRVNLPLVTPVHMANRTFEVAENVFVRVTGGGFVGWGEATSAVGTTGESADDIERRLRGFVATAFHRGRSTQLLARDAARSLARAPAARSALDIALLDLAARGAGLPAWQLLAPDAEPRPIELSVIVTVADPDDEVEATETAWRSGFTRVKLKVGRRSVDVEAEIIRAIRARPGIGSTLVLGADANESLTLDQAIVLANLAGDGLDYLEQPLPRDDLNGLAALRRTIRVPIVVDEGVGGSSDVTRHAAAGAAAGVMLKLQKAGSAKRLLRAADVARRLGLVVGLTGKVAESGIASAALVHLGVAFGPVGYGASLTSSYLAIDPVAPRLAIDGGVVRVGAGPGLGVAVDESAISPYVVRRA